MISIAPRDRASAKALDDPHSVILQGSVSARVFLIPSVGGRERTLPLPAKDVKLAAERYDPNDGLVPESPPLQPQIFKLMPSPSPEYLLSDTSSSSSENRNYSPKSKGRKRPRPQASQGDRVLVGLMGGLNHPDLAARAGDEPLPQSDDSEFNDSMDKTEGEGTNDKPVDPVHLAGDALSIVEKKTGPSEGFPDRPRNENLRPELPKLVTDEDVRSTEEASDGSISAPHPVTNGASEQNSLIRTFSRAATDGPSLNPRLSGSPSRSPGDTNEIMSPNLRRYTMPTHQIPEKQTLPAMQRSPPSASAKSPNGALPSLHDQGLKPLLHVESRPLSKNGPHGVPQPNVPIGSPSAHSPPGSSVSSIAPRPSQFSSPRTRTNSSFSQGFLHGQPSPAYSSDTSPKETTNMSPPGRPGGQYQFFSKSQSEALTPQSAESYPSSSSFSAGPSPRLENMDIDRSGRILPPLIPHPGPPLMTGAFKCDYVGCTAAPFQTQYLLNSHANVHSQNRPHYCPVPNCSRSEGGRGFKRKNEMIRHGLVHESPGYICPFCPEREHKYPRPDNLQRHVRGNHKDKDMNDQKLRDVLSQRLEGGHRGRRRRLNNNRE